MRTLFAIAWFSDRSLIDSADRAVAWSSRAQFVRRRPRWVLLFDERIDTVIQPWVNAGDPELPLDPDFREQLLATKASEFSEIELQRAADIETRSAEPITDFFVDPTPPSVFLNFEILADQREALAAAIPLPEGFELARVRSAPGRTRILGDAADVRQNGVGRTPDYGSQESCTDAERQPGHR